MPVLQLSTVYAAVTGERASNSAAWSSSSMHRRAESRGYLEYYGQLREAGLPDQDLFDAMVTHDPDWVGRQQFLILGS